MCSFGVYLSYNENQEFAVEGYQNVAKSYGGMLSLGPLHRRVLESMNKKKSRREKRYIKKLVIQLRYRQSLLNSCCHILTQNRILPLLSSEKQNCIW